MKTLPPARWDHFDHTFHDVVAGEDFAGFGHDFFDGLPGAGFLKCGGGEHGHGLGWLSFKPLAFRLSATSAKV